MQINQQTGCYCTLIQKLVGDGCMICNTEYWKEMMEDDEELMPCDEKKEMTLDEILKLKFECRDLNKMVTISEYLKTLLKTLWEEEEGFSGKRPFGNSGWKSDIFECLVKNSVIDGRLDSEGYIDRIDYDTGDKIIYLLLDYLFDEKEDE